MQSHFLKPVLADETQKDFWVMKMIDDSTAVKVPFKRLKPGSG
jgi:hypothetical protein